MTRDQVKAQSRRGPYTPVHSTGGLETRNGVFRGQRRNISFVFDKKGLRYIQVWMYEGDQYGDARVAAGEIFDLFKNDWGGVEVADLAGTGSDHPSREAFLSLLDREVGGAPGLHDFLLAKQKASLERVSVSLRPHRQPSDGHIQAEIAYVSHRGTREFVFLVFLFQDRPHAVRRFEARRVIYVPERQVAPTRRSG